MCVRIEYLCIYGAVCSISINLSFFDTQHDYFQKKMFWPLVPPKVWMVRVRTEYMIPCCGICNSLWFNMQHDHILKKLNSELFTRPGSREGSMVKIFATMLLQASFPLIWYATWLYSKKKLNFGLCSTSCSSRGPYPGLETKIMFDMFIYLLYLRLHATFQ